MAPRDLARLPVVSPDSPGRLLGLISRSDILRAYDVAIVRKQRGQMLGNNVALRRKENNTFNEFVLHPGDSGVGRELHTLDLPENVNVVSVERSGMTLIPRGKTCFAAGDIVSVFGNKAVMDQVRRILTTSKPLE